jgi:hypothetical protein
VSIVLAEWHKGMLELQLDDNLLVVDLIGFKADLRRRPYSLNSVLNSISNDKSHDFRCFAPLAEAIVYSRRIPDHGESLEVYFVKDAKRKVLCSKASVMGAATSPDGKMIAVAFEDRTASEEFVTRRILVLDSKGMIVGEVRRGRASDLKSEVVAGDAASQKAAIGRNTLNYWTEVEAIFSRQAKTLPADRKLKTEQIVRLFRSTAAEVERLPTKGVDITAVECVIELCSVCRQMADFCERQSDPALVVVALVRGLTLDVEPVNEANKERTAITASMTEWRNRMLKTRAALTSTYEIEFPILR